MCLGMNPDKLKPGQRCASTSNRNFEGRQGPAGARTCSRPPWRRRRRSPASWPTCATGSRRGGRGMMQPFTTLTGVAAPLPMANVDTDKIIPRAS
jgi:hypothetical protein